jgi:hypothetical protein
MIDEDRTTWTLAQLADEVIEACALPMGCRATIIAALGDAKDQGRAELAAVTQELAALKQGCQCPACCGGVKHDSDCAVHNMPAEPNGPCNCGAAPYAGGLEAFVVAARRVAGYLTAKEPIDYIRDGEAWNARARFLQLLKQAEDARAALAAKPVAEPRQIGTSGKGESAEGGS